MATVTATYLNQNGTIIKCFKDETAVPIYDNGDPMAAKAKVMYCICYCAELPPGKCKAQILYVAICQGGPLAS